MASKTDFSNIQCTYPRDGRGVFCKISGFQISGQQQEIIIWNGPESEIMSGRRKDHNWYRSHYRAFYSGGHLVLDRIRQNNFMSICCVGCIHNDTSVCDDPNYQVYYIGSLVDNFENQIWYYISYSEDYICTMNYLIFNYVQESRCDIIKHDKYYINLNTPIEMDYTRSEFDIYLAPGDTDKAIKIAITNLHMLLAKLSETISQSSLIQIPGLVKMIVEYVCVASRLSPPTPAATYHDHSQL